MDTDITLAIRIEDMCVLEETFQTRPPKPGPQISSGLGVTVPQVEYHKEKEAGADLVRSTVSIRYSLMDSETDAGECLRFGLTAEVTDSVPSLNSGAHSVSQKNIEHALLREAVSTAYGLATSRLLDVSALSPFGKVYMPTIDGDALLRDIQARGDLK